MGRKPVIFKPQLFEPEGLNNYPGTTFRCFTKGDTLPFKFTFGNSDGSVPDITNWKVFVSFSDIQATSDKVIGDQTIVETEIPIGDIPTGVFEGSVTDTDTNTIPEGLVYAMAKYVDASGQSFILDMCILEVYPSITFGVTEV